MTGRPVIATFLAVLLLATSLGLAGCGQEDPASSGDPTSSQSSVQKETGEAATTDKAEKQEEEKEKKQEQEEEATQTESNTVQSREQSEPATAGNQSSEQQSSTSSQKKETKKEEKKGSCTISISAGKLLSSDQASEETKAIIPAKGQILSKQTVTLQKGDTVKSVLLRVTEKKGIAVSVSGGNYVQGIAGLFEFDGGDQSGWMYRVNGTFPQMACSDYKVKDGDTIQWLYTCANGDDL